MRYKGILYALLLFFFIGETAAQQSQAVRQLQERRKATMAAINEAAQMLTQAQKTTKSSVSELQLLTAEIRSRRDVINMLNQEIKGLDRQQRTLQRETNRLTKELQDKKERYAKAMRGLYAKRSQYNRILFILSASTLDQSYRRMRYLKEYAAWRKNEATDIIARQAELEEKQKVLQATKIEKEALLSTRTQEREVLADKEKKQQELVSGLKKKERSLKADLEKKKKQAEALNRQIEKLIADEIAASRAKEQKTPQPAGGKVSAKTSTSYVQTKEEKLLSGSLEKNKGRLPFPISGSYLIIGHFGEQQHQEHKYVRTNNSGIDVQTKPGTAARCVFDGVVTRVLVIENLINVLVRHGDYVTVYANLSQVSVKQGEKVTARQTLGTVYSDPQDGGRTVLHFQLWKNQTKLNPELWLSR